MSRMRHSGLGCVTLLVIGGVVYVWSQSVVGGVVTTVVAVSLLVYLNLPRRCNICGNVLKRSTYVWRIDGKKTRVCPHCNSSLERRQSRRGMSRYNP